MKKEYLKPHVKVSALMYELSLLDGTPNRGIGGDPTSGTGGITPTVNETGGEGNPDPFGGHGQGSGGSGTRAKSYNVWEY